VGHGVLSKCQLSQGLGHGEDARLSQNGAGRRRSVRCGRGSEPVAASMTESNEPKGKVGGTNPLAEMAMGYFRSRALCAAARLGIADVMDDGERTVEQLATACGADRTALHRLL